MAKTKSVSPELTGGETCVALCKHPGGLVLQLWDFAEAQEIGPGGVRTVRVSRKAGRSITIAGPARSFFDADVRRKIDFDILDGYAVTPGIPAEFARLWQQTYATSDLVRNKIVMFVPDLASAKSCAKDHAAVRSGFEPIDPANLQASGGRDPLKVETSDVR